MNHQKLLDEYYEKGFVGIEKELRNSKQGNSHTESSYKDVVTFVSIFFSNINFMSFDEFHAAFARYVPETLPEEYKKNPEAYPESVRQLGQRMLASIK